ncbi:MAG TPA: type II toxin-antitoxin system CcdA family antitoxin [Vicinamibacteria bacterium]|nr:type II toxin-antitoxin system CcdA family antitoxin [Vicinamibacteria bacterium]
MAAKANVTLTIDADLLREARILAAEEGTSVSGLLRDRLEELVRRHKAYDAARRRALARLRTGYDLQWTPPRSRDELHER